MKRSKPKRAAAIEPLEARTLLASGTVLNVTNDGISDVPEANGLYSTWFTVANVGEEATGVVWKLDLSAGDAAPADFNPGYFDSEGNPVESAEILLAPGQSDRFAVHVADDLELEPDEAFSVRILGTGDGTEYQNDTAHKTIKDNDVSITTENGGSTGVTVTYADYERQRLKVVDYHGSPVSGVPVYVVMNYGGVTNVWSHDLSDADGIAEIEMSGIGTSSGSTVVVAKTEFADGLRSEYFTYGNPAALPLLKWAPQALSGGTIKAPWVGNVRVTGKIMKYDGSRNVRWSSVPIETGMTHNGAYDERQGDIYQTENAAVNGQFNMLLTGRMIAQMDGSHRNPHGSTQVWFKLPAVDHFKFGTVQAEKPILTVNWGSAHVTSTPLTITANLRTSQGLPVVGAGMGGKVVNEDHDMYLGWGTGENAWANNETTAPGATDVNGNITFTPLSTGWTNLLTAADYPDVIVYVSGLYGSNLASWELYATKEISIN